MSEEKVESFGEYIAKITFITPILNMLNEIIINTAPYRPKNQVMKRLKELRKKFECRICGYKGIPLLDYDGQLKCHRCGEYVEGNWIDYGEYKALKWVLSYKPKKRKNDK
jgi:hypothetical protein